MIKWLFETSALNISTINTTHGGTTYAGVVIPGSFSGINLRWNIAGNGLIAPNELSFEVSNPDDTYALSDFQDETCTIKLIIDDVQKRIWKFKIHNAVNYYKKITCFCADFLQEYLRGSFPNTKNPKEVWPSDDEDSYDDYCTPVILGTAYIPVRSVNTGTERYYVLGLSGPTYTVSEVRSPKEWPSQSVWTAASYTMTGSVSGGYQLLQPIIADSDGDGTVDAPGLWRSGNLFYDMLCKYSKNTTAALTNPAEWVEFLLEEYGVASALIDPITFAAADASYDTDSISFDGGWWKKGPRERTLANLLAQIDSYIVPTDTVELHRFSKTSQETVTNVKLNSFRANKVNKSANDSGRVSWPESTSKPQDELTGKIVVPLYEGGTTNDPSSEELQCSFLCGQSQNAQKAGILFFQKKFDQKWKLSFSTELTSLTNQDTLTPGQVITVNNAVYGGSSTMIITDMTITRELDVQISGVVLNHLNDWADLIPSAVTIVEDDSYAFTPATTDDLDQNPEKIKLVSGVIAILYDSAGINPAPASVDLSAEILFEDVSKTYTYAFYLHDVATDTWVLDQTGASPDYTFTPVADIDTGIGFDPNAVMVKLLVGSDIIDMDIHYFYEAQPSLTGINAGNWSSTIVFSSSAYNVVNWAAGQLITPGEAPFNINAGSTGVMVAGSPYFIYFTPGSPTTLQVSTDPTDAVGWGQVMVAVAKVNEETGATEAIFQAFGGVGGSLIAGDYIVGNTITGNHFVANLITTSKIQDPAGNAVGEENTLFLGGATGGTFTLGDGTTNTSALAYNESAANIQAALVAIYGADTVTVAAGTDFTITFATSVGVSALAADFTSLTGATSPSLTITTAYVAEYSDLIIDFDNAEITVNHENGLVIDAPGGLKVTKDSSIKFVGGDGDAAWEVIPTITDSESPYAFLTITPTNMPVIANWFRVGTDENPISTISFTADTVASFVVGDDSEGGQKNVYSLFDDCFISFPPVGSEPADLGRPEDPWGDLYASIPENHMWSGDSEGKSVALPTDATQILRKTQAEYDALTPVATTLYLIPVV